MGGSPLVEPSRRIKLTTWKKQGTASLLNQAQFERSKAMSALSTQRRASKRVLWTAETWWCSRKTSISRHLSSARPRSEGQHDDSHHWRHRRYNVPNTTTPKIPMRGAVQPLNNSASDDATTGTLATTDSGMGSGHTSSAPRYSAATDYVESQAESYDLISPTSLRYTGDAVMPITSTLNIVKPQDDTPRGVWPVFRLMDESGDFRDPSRDGSEHDQSRPTALRQFSRKPTQDIDDLAALRSHLADAYPHQASEVEASGLLQSSNHVFADTNSTNTLLRAHRQMVRLRAMDTILQNAQRQGRVSFYMTCTGEEAIHFGSASALDGQDHIFAQYREQGLLMWRGFTLEQFTNQCFSNDRDLGKGRQMPIHYGSRALNYHTVSSPLGTQLPQAVGTAYRLKLMGKPNVAICFFGDGCASTTDFHAALNFAATLSAPVIFFCRNNGYAISTPVTDQYAGDGVVSRAPGFGMAAIRVDGNDIFAVHAAVREAKKYALERNAPVLIEGMTYRLGHHSTSDDSTRYRSEDEVENFADRMDPLLRFTKFLKRHNLLNDEELATMKDDERIAVLNAIKEAESRPMPSMESMFEDVYKDMPLHLKDQMAQLKAHVAKHPGKY